MESSSGSGSSGIMAAVSLFKLSAAQRDELEGIVGRPSEAAGLVRRARVVLLSAAGVRAVRSRIASTCRRRPCLAYARGSAWRALPVFSSGEKRAVRTRLCPPTSLRG